MFDPKKTLISTGALAQLTKTSKSFWEKKRSAGEGPKYIKIGRNVLYRMSDAEDWLDAHEVNPGGLEK